MPKFLIVRSMVKSEKISADDQQEYWLGEGMLMYLVELSCPNFANMTTKLSKANNGGNLVHKRNFYL